MPDFAVSATFTDFGGTDTGSVTAYSGATYLPLWTTNGLVANDQFGVAVARAGDLTGDGVPDVAVGTPWSSVGGLDSGSLTILSGVDGARVVVLNGNNPTDFFGASVSGWGDYDGDGFPDVLVGAYSTDVGGTNTGSVSVVSLGPYLRPCAASNVPGSGSTTFDQIRLNGTAGGLPRRVDVPVCASFTLSFHQPPTFALAAPIWAFGKFGVPTAGDELSAGLGLGTICFPPPMWSPSDPTLFIFSDSFVTSASSAFVASSPPGAWSLTMPGGLPLPVRVAIGGVTSDGSAFFRTNTILLDVH